jgi:hypothetical protein
MEGRRRSMEPAGPSLPRAEVAAKERRYEREQSNALEWDAVELGESNRNGGVYIGTAAPIPCGEGLPDWSGQRAQVGACDREIRLVSVWLWGERLNRRGMQCRAQ